MTFSALGRRSLNFLRQSSTQITFKNNGFMIHQQRFCTNISTNRTVEDVMSMSSNKATRFVYMRTLPLIKQPELEGEVDKIVDVIESNARQVCQNHLSTVTDDRAAVHLHTTALAIATHRVLSARIRNEIRVSNIIRAGFGATPLKDTTTDAGSENTAQSSSATIAEKSRPDFWIVRAALWFSWDRMAAIRRMTQNMIRDFGNTFETDTVDGGDQEHALIIKKCYYNRICTEEKVPHLTKIFCALDKAIYSPITVASHGIQFDLERTIADDGITTDNQKPKTCVFKFAKHK